MICEREVRDPDSPSDVYIFRFEDNRLTNIECKSPYGGWNADTTADEYDSPIEHLVDGAMKILGKEILDYNPDFMDIRVV